MILGLLPMATFAEDTATKPVVHLTADKTTVLAGEEVTLTLTLDGDVSGSVCGWEWDFVYDSAYFEYVSSKVGTATQPLIEDMEELAVTPIVNPTPAGDWTVGTYKYASVTSGDGLTAHYLKKGTIASLTLKAKGDIEEEIASKFYFVPVIVEDKKGNALDVVDADATTCWDYADFKARTEPADTVGLAVTIAKPVEPIDITVYYADNGQIVTSDKDGETLLNFATVHVTDMNGDNKLTMYDGFACFHEQYHTNGVSGYTDNNWVTKFWSVSTAMFSYGHNNRWVYSTAEEIADGDSLCLFTYQDQNSWSDLYTYFDNLTDTATAGEEKTFHVNGYSFFGSGRTADAVANPEGATVTASCDGQTDLTTTTDAEGNFKLTFPTAGDWTVLVNGTCSYTCDVGYYAGQTYTNAPVTPAQMTVTVAESTNPPVVPDEPDKPVVESGYTVTMPTDTSAVVNETVEIKPVVGYSDETVTTYNAFDMTFTYDSDALELTSTTEENGPTVTVNNGTIRVQGYGADRNVGTAPFTLTFKALKTGNTSVTVTSAKVDISENAIGADAPEAELVDADTTIAVGGYPVTLPEDFTGGAVAEPGDDYTFEATNKNYDYTFSGTTMGGESVDVVDNEDGTFTIENVTGAIDVKSEKIGKTFDVTLGTDMSGADKAQYMTDYKATLTKDEDHYTYEVSVTIGGEKYNGYTVSEGVYTIPGEDITGEIVFTVTKTAITGKYFNVTFEGSGAGDAEGQNTATPDAPYSFTLNEETGYKYDVTAKMGNQDASVTEEDGTYTIAKVTGNLVITIEKTLDVTVAVDKFVELDGKTVFLVTATVSLDQGKALTYGGTTMFYSDGADSTDEMSTGYNAWCYLVIVEENTAFTVQDATDKISVATSDYTTLTATKDVNESDKVDINDAQLVYDIYKGKYEDFGTVTMQKFLNADVNHDRTVDVTDAAAVVAAIQ